MPVDTCHPDYEAHRDEWCLMRDVSAGHKAVQAKGEVYLPKLSDQTPEEYQAYKQRATFFNATGRVVDALTGMVFRKDAVLEKADGIQDILEDVTLNGTPFRQFAENLVEQVMKVNRAGVLVDFPDAKAAAGDKVVTQALADALGLRVYASIYSAEDILNWRTISVGGKTVLSLVVLRECIEVIDPTDMFVMKKQLQYRVLELFEGRYLQTVWAQTGTTGGKTALSVVARAFPLRGGKPLDSIPFEFFSSEGGDTCVHEPVLYDLAVVNLAHYRNTADHEHGLHFTGLPTAVISGVNGADDTYRIGSTTAWVFADPQAKAAYLEFTGAGLGELRDAIKDKEGQMAALGARMLAPEKADAEAADTIAQKRQGETSTLAALANSVSRGLTRVLNIMAEWHGNTSPTVVVKLNTDFLAVSMPPQQITALLQSVMAGKLSAESFYEALVKGEVISGNRTYEEEKVKIDEDGASAPPPNPNGA
ncbi:DUF4055 domain-containing protein [Mesorhizobium sp. M2D.F.Ca.ET.223.01.1.1]|uniref:DUF4055 domain-containing protein n=1 Tax=unclassified Mesorhizobium TaxID=325217 RepID=UPI000FCB2C1E|nr:MULTISPECIES: DUF4055 domain-containing protein [unclassified Mesorhizobium]TGP89343.1 DUF4055 domain-containing protein [bacterium M00.F.Ca.ET.221.01.1.1]TGP94716.1 DUF4055 domain-containing protein [bacterium M00.F.Ca.ET.222.01.1.1]RVD58870.1 DUF4055 domain-containing protein [Mesorhizobium sp. M2D.F.Ca.ET.140.01.1.1]TGP27899.1 DUF4055 domain-containing protein [Mesorhizobium sp. M2D.F.Ca.ET.232.01.1.1]TGP75884.1 DUF4055 domain-containing protein [Mesorhizobium sp. M2D.F.Ca.ET.224.01.1.1]